MDREAARLAAYLREGLDGHAAQEAEPGQGRRLAPGLHVSMNSTQRLGIRIGTLRGEETCLLVAAPQLLALAE